MYATWLYMLWLESVAIQLQGVVRHLTTNLSPALPLVLTHLLLSHLISYSIDLIIATS